MRMRLGIVVLTVLMSGLAAAPAGAKAPRVLRVGTPPKAVTAGGKLRLGVTAKPATAKLGVYLSRDRRHDQRDTSLGTARPRKGRITVTVPKRTKPAAYHVLVCAGRRCTATRRTIRVAGRGKPPTPIPAPGPGPGPVAPGGSTPGPITFAGLPSLATAPSPVAVHPAADPAHAATKTIGTAGGDLTATGADGSTFTLSIPAGALLSDEPITLTPVGSIPDLPFTTAPAAAVQLGPDGLRLQTPATLTIVPVQPIPLADQTGFGWHADGTDFHLTPLGTDPAKIALTLWHFSGAGVGGGTADQRAAQQQHLPQTPEDRLEQQLAQATDAARRGDGAVDGSAQADWFVSAFDNVVLPAVQAASQDDTRIADAVTALLSWAHTTAVLTDPDKADPRIKSRFDQVIPLFSALLDAAYAKAKQGCDAGDVSQVVRLYQVARFQAILGMPVSPADTDAAKCATFKLSLDEAVSYTQFMNSVTADWHVDDLLLAPDGQGRIHNTATLQDGGWTVNSMWGGDCPTSKGIADPGDPMPVDLSLDYNWRTEKDAQGINRDVVGPAKITLKLGDARPTNNFTATCSTNAETQVIPYAMPMWTMAWMSRQSRLNAQTETFDTTFTSQPGSPIVDVAENGHTEYYGAVVDDTFHVVLDHAG